MFIRVPPNKKSRTPCRMRGEKWRRCSRKIHTYFGVLLYHGTAVFVNCGKGQPPKAMGFWRRVVRPTGFEPAAYRVGVCHSIQLSYGRILGCRCTSSLGIIAVLPTDVKPFWKNFFAERLLKKLTTIVSCGRISP